MKQQVQPGWYPPNEPFRDGPRGKSQIPNCPSFHSFKVVHPLRKSDHPDLFKDAEGFKRYSRRFNIDLAPKILFSKSLSVDKLIESGVANYLEFNNVNDSYFFNPGPVKEPSKEAAAKTAEAYEQIISNKMEQLQQEMVKIPFSKSEIFTNNVLTFKEKRQLVKVIEMCLEGTDNMDDEQHDFHSDDDEEEKEAARQQKKKSQNSTHIYDKDIKLTEKELQQMQEKRNQPIVELFKSM